MQKSSLFILIFLFGMAGAFPGTGPRATPVACLSMESSAPVKTDPPGILIEENTIFQNNRSGLRIRGSLPVTVRGGKIYQNGRGGINLQYQAVVTMERCDVFNNANAGINLENSALLILKDSTIHQNRTGGIRVRTAGKKAYTEVKILSSRIFRNRQGGILSWPDDDASVELTVERNRIYRNRKAGIRVENSTILTATDNRIYKNGTAGISSWGTGDRVPKLDVYHNTIAFNEGAGINIDSGITGKQAISDNWIHNNLRAGIACGIRHSGNSKMINVQILNNTIVGNGSNTEGAGIRSDAGRSVRIINNIIAYNFTTGILTSNCRNYSHNLLFANGEVPNCCDDQDDIPFWIEKLQYAGCSGRGSGDLITDPLFVDPDRYNFYLQAESPARGTGENIYGTDRLPAEKIDMGATGGLHPFRNNTSAGNGGR